MIRVALFVALLLGSIAPVADAQEPFPSRPITIVNPFPPGGLADLTARPVAAAMERILKQPVLVVNKPGAAGAIGAQTVATAKPDGYTIVIHVNAIGTIPEVDTLFARAPTFTRDHFVTIARLNADPTIIVVNSDLPWKTMKDLDADEFKTWFEKDTERSVVAIRRIGKVETK